MRQAQQMQENMKKAQEALAELTVEGAAGGGLVKVTMSCKYDVKRVTIDPSLYDDDRDMIEAVIRLVQDDGLLEGIRSHNRTVRPPFDWEVVLDAAAAEYSRASGLIR